MSFVSSFVTTKMRNLHDGAIKTLAKWDPESVGEAQLEEWNTQAKEMAQTAARAATDANTAKTALENVRANANRYTAAAEKLISAGNEEAAEKAADAALEWKNKLTSAEADAADATAWAAETLSAAQRAQKLVMEGRDKIERAKREQARAMQEAAVAESRRADRERMAGISHGLSGADVAISAMAANTKAAKEKAAADNIRSGVLGKAVETDDAVNAALADVDGTNKPMTLAEKMAALKNK